jgi:hypothetical protein
MNLLFLLVRGFTFVWNLVCHFKDEHRSTVFDKEVLRRTSGLGQGRQQEDGEMHKMRMRWNGHVERTGGINSDFMMVNFYTKR